MLCHHLITSWLAFCKIEFLITAFWKIFISVDFSAWFKSNCFSLCISPPTWLDVWVGIWCLLRCIIENHLSWFPSLMKGSFCKEDSKPHATLMMNPYMPRTIVSPLFRASVYSYLKDPSDERDILRSIWELMPEEKNPAWQPSGISWVKTSIHIMWWRGQMLWNFLILSLLNALSTLRNN